MTKTQMAKLKPYEYQMRLAMNDIAPGLLKEEAKVIYDIYNALFNDNKAWSRCPACNLSIVKRLANIYFKEGNK